MSDGANFKVCMLGAQGVGKTALVERFLHPTAQFSTAHPPVSFEYRHSRFPLALAVSPHPSRVLVARRPDHRCGLHDKNDAACGRSATHRDGHLGRLTITHERCARLRPGDYFRPAAGDSHILFLLPCVPLSFRPPPTTRTLLAKVRPT